MSNEKLEKSNAAGSLLEPVVMRELSTETRQAALVDSCDGITIIDPKDAPVFISKNGGDPVERDSKEPLVHTVCNGMLTLSVPLSAKDTDTLGKIVVYANTENALPSVFTADVVDA